MLNTYRKGATFFGEIHAQPQGWKRVLDTMTERKESIIGWLKAQNIGQVLYVSSGELLGVAESAARVTRLVSVCNSLAVPASELMFGRRVPYDARIKTLVVVLSRSNVAEEIGWGIEKLRSIDPRVAVMALEVGEGKMGALADLSVSFEIAEETKTAIGSVTGLLLASFVLVSWLSGKEKLYSELVRLPDILSTRLKEWQAKAQRVVQTKPTQILFLGSGPFYGVARASSLAVSRTAGLPSNADFYAECIHGGYAGLNNLMTVVGFVSNSFLAMEEKALGDLAVMRCNRIAIAEQDNPELSKRTDEVFELKSEVSEIARVLLVLPVAQLLAFYAAMSRGVNPDNPKHLDHPALSLKERPGTKAGA